MSSSTLHYISTMIYKADIYIQFLQMKMTQGTNCLQINERMAAKNC